MRLLKKRSVVFYLGFFFILMMAVMGAAIGAFADGGTSQVTLTSGGSVSEVTNFTAPIAATLTGQNQTKTYNFGTEVTDPSGSGAGWHLQISGSPLACPNGPCTATPLTQQVFSVSTACGLNSTCTNAIASTDQQHMIQYPLPIGSAAPFFSAAANSGLGVIDATTSVTVTIPGNAYTGAYSSTISIAITSGP